MKHIKNVIGCILSCIVLATGMITGSAASDPSAETEIFSTDPTDPYMTDPPDETVPTRAPQESYCTISVGKVLSNDDLGEVTLKPGETVTYEVYVEGINGCGNFISYPYEWKIEGVSPCVYSSIDTRYVWSNGVMSQFELTITAGDEGTGTVPLDITPPLEKPGTIAFENQYGEPRAAIKLEVGSITLHVQSDNATDSTETLTEPSTDPTEPATEPKAIYGDFNHDGVVNASDATVILLYAAEYGAGTFTGTFEEYVNR
ncbi:MAG: hypothetical protein IKN55_04610 [Oscillospiraceae bacterium]|nr:hypothetical protein [Oscillospiraceae bacterium]